MPEVLGGAAEYFRSGDMQELMAKIQMMLDGEREKQYAPMRKYDWEEEAKQMLRWLADMNEDCKI